MALLMTATVVTGLAPILVYFWPAPPKAQKHALITVSLNTALDQMANDNATKIEAPSSPNSAFIMKDGGGDNAPGELAFGGYVVKVDQQIHVFAQNCPHLGCSINFNASAKTFDCPCHGSRFHLNGTVLHGPAAYPLADLAWQQGDKPDEIKVEGLQLGF
jgi:Rieske Fe-S protein